MNTELTRKIIIHGPKLKLDSPLNPDSAREQHKAGCYCWRLGARQKLAEGRNND